jgi:hypothetical protein
LGYNPEMTHLVLLALATVSLATPPADPPTPSCASGHLVKEKPKLWRTRLASADPNQFDALLAEMALPPIPADLTGVEFDRVDLFRAQLADDPESEEAVVQAKFTAHRRPAGEEDAALSDLVRIYRIQVLQNVGPGVFCALGSELSADQPVQTLNAGPAEGMHDEYGPLTFGFTTLTHPDRQTIEVVQPMTVHSRTTGTRTRHAFWNVSGGKLLQVLEIDAFDLVAHGTKDRGSFERGTTVPQVVTAVREVCGDDGEPCEKTETVHTFYGSTYGLEPTQCGL